MPKRESEHFVYILTLLFKPFNDIPLLGWTKYVLIIWNILSKNNDQFKEEEETASMEVNLLVFHLMALVFISGK